MTNLNIEENFEIRTVMELPVKTSKPQFNVQDNSLAKDIDYLRIAASYVETPDGWFVPINDLLPRISKLADFLRSETLQTEQFEIIAGVEIRSKDQILLRVPFSSNFRIVADFIDRLLKASKSSDAQSVMIGNDDRLVLSIEDKNILIENGRPCRILSRPVRFPREDLNTKVEVIISEIITLAQGLRREWDREGFKQVNEEHFNWMFALDLWTQLDIK